MAVAADTSQRSDFIPVATAKAAHVGLLINLPLKITSLDRGQFLSDGTLVYLTSPDAGVAIDPGTGSLRTIYGGLPFAKGARRTVVLGGLWVSSWSASGATCGPDCWAGANTYRMDLATGGISGTFSATYLLGATSDAVWVAVDKQIERLDPSTGAIKSSTPWKGSGEPRVGCNSLWSFTAGDKGSAIALIDPDRQRHRQLHPGPRAHIWTRHR